MFPELNHFLPHEFDSPDLKGSHVHMDSGFLMNLDRARHIANVPFIINSAYRTMEHNNLVGGIKDSSHLKGLAVDIKCVTSQQREKILFGLINAGFRRIGIGKNFIHVDSDYTKTVGVVWLY